MIRSRNRYILCMLLCGWMVYYAGPRLNIFQSGIEGVFALSWLLFALMVIAGNLSAILYSSKQHNHNNHIRPKLKQKSKIRSYHG